MCASYLYFKVDVTLQGAAYMATNCTPHLHFFSQPLVHPSRPLLIKTSKFPSRLFRKIPPFNTLYSTAQPQNPTAPPTTAAAAIIPIPISANFPVTIGAAALLLLVAIPPPKPPSALCFPVLILVLVPPLPLPPL